MKKHDGRVCYIGAFADDLRWLSRPQKSKIQPDRFDKSQSE